MAVKNFGGEIRLTLQGGERIVLRGSLSQDLSGEEGTVTSNLDGSMYRTTALMPYKFGFAFEYDAGIDYNEVSRRTGFSCEFIHLTQGEVVTLQDCAFEGRPSFDPMTGEVTGLMVCTATRPVRVAL